MKVKAATAFPQKRIENERSSNCGELRKRGRKSGEGGKKNREEKGKEEIKGRRMGGGSGSCAAIQQIFTLRRRFPLEELSRDFAR